MTGVAGLGRMRRPILMRRFARVGPVVGTAGVVLVLIVLVAVFAPLVAPHGADAVDATASYAGSSGSHPLSTDANGRDILSRLIFGSRISLIGPAIVMLLAVPVGTFLAVLAAWCGGFVDAAVSRFVEVLYSFPGLILAVVTVAIFGAGFWAPVLALSIGFIPLIVRIMRSVALRERNLPYVAALQIQGVSATRIAWRHIVPNLLPMVLVQTGIGFGYAMLDLSAISYLGLGLQPPVADWGVMISEGQTSIIEGFPQESLYAALVVLVTVVSINLVSGWLAERYDVSGVQA